jgi:hypothetical protein
MQKTRQRFVYFAVVYVDAGLPACTRKQLVGGFLDGLMVVHGGLP